MSRSVIVFSDHDKVRRVGVIKDDSKRQLLTRSLRLAALLALPSWGMRSSFADEFEDYKLDLNKGLFQQANEFSQYKKKYQAAYRAYQAEIVQFWSEVEVSGRKTWVDYSPAMDVKRVVDFNKNEIRISIQGDALKGFSPAATEREILATLMTDIDQAYRTDPILSKTIGPKPPGSNISVLGIAADMAKSMRNQASLQRKPGKQGEVLTIVAKFPDNSLAKRAYGYVAEVQKAASRWQVPAPLVLAVIDTESSFNPMARSHVPAFGLMQIVPKSAGRDASRLVFGRERLLTGVDLYNPSTNIQLGAAYLHLLDSRYLKGIKDPKSRQLCVIAAYNTGAGNVAWAFTGTKSIKKALPLINRLSSKQVYAHLRSNLKYKEAREYVQKVTRALPLYSYA